MPVWEMILVGVILTIFGVLMFGAYLIVDDKQKEWEKRNGKRK